MSFQCLFFLSFSNVVPFSVSFFTNFTQFKLQSPFITSYSSPSPPHTPSPPPLTCYTVMKLTPRSWRNLTLVDLVEDFQVYSSWSPPPPAHSSKQDLPSRSRSVQADCPTSVLTGFDGRTCEDDFLNVFPDFLLKLTLQDSVLCR